MAVASISLPQKLGVKLREKAKEAGYLPEEFDIVTFFGVATALYKNFYENEMARESVEFSAENIEKLVDKLRKFAT